MNLLGRAIRFFLFVAGVIAGLIVAFAALLARKMVRPERLRLWADPSDVGLAYEEVQFPATDGLRLAGWFIKGSEVASRAGATVVLVHGWGWNRLGNLVDDAVERMLGSTPVDLLRLAHALHHEGYNVLMFDLRNHGASAESPPVTFGLKEAGDILGAVNFLRNRAETDAQRIGVLGFSLGANALLYALPRTVNVKAGVAVQPASMQIYGDGLGTYALGPLGKPAVWLAERIYQAAGGPPLNAIEPIFAAAGAGETPVLYVQGEGDRWGSVSNVAQMAAATPKARPHIVDTTDRYGGFQYVVDNPNVVLRFFGDNL